jgi:hypothetical protein
VHKGGILKDFLDISGYGKRLKPQSSCPFGESYEKNTGYWWPGTDRF